MSRIKSWTQAFGRAIEWRALAFFIDFAIIFAFTGEVKFSTEIAVLSAFVKFIINSIWIRKRFS